jgi:hypothetical protein
MVPRPNFFLLNRYEYFIQLKKERKRKKGEAAMMNILSSFDYWVDLYEGHTCKSME